MTVSGTSNIQGNTTPLTSSSQKILGKDDFLRIFIEQLKNQDPLKPLEDKEFIAQMAQFSTLEQLTNINTASSDMVNNQNKMLALLEMMSSGQNSHTLADYSNLIGMTGYWTNSDGIESAGEISSLIMKNHQIFAMIDGTEVEVSDLLKIEKGVANGTV